MRKLLLGDVAVRLVGVVAGQVSLTVGHQRLEALAPAVDTLRDASFASKTQPGRDLGLNVAIRRRQMLPRRRKAEAVEDRGARVVIER